MNFGTYVQRLRLKPNTHRRRDATVELSCVGRVDTIRNLATVSTSLNKFANSEVELRSVGAVNSNTAVGSRDPIYNISCIVEPLRLVTSDNIMSVPLQCNALHETEYKITCGVCVCARTGFWGSNISKTLRDRDLVTMDNQ